MEGSGFLLPPEIVQLLHRKSSRDPMSRFSNKLHILLGYAGDDPALQESIGAGWVDDTQFRINKKRLIITMEIKLNTLNVNLKDLKFRQVRVDQDGWTVWERAGFTRESTPGELAGVRDECTGDTERAVPGDDHQQTKLVALRDLSLGMTDASTLAMFKSFMIAIWEELVRAPGEALRYVVDSDELLGPCAKRFRVSHQKLENARSIMKAIFLRPEIDQVSVLDFAKFMARFGPEETLMLKIQSLLKSSNDNQNWMKISGDLEKYQHDPVYGFFDESEHNCIVIQRFGMEPERIYNLVEAAATENYLIDAKGRTYGSWQAYFDLNPLNKGRPYNWA